MGFIKDAVGGAIDWLNTRTKKARDRDVETRAEKAVAQEQKEAVTISNAAAKSAGAIKRMEIDLDDAKANQAKWDNRAKIAAGKQDMDGLKQAVSQKAVWDQKVKDLEAEIAKAKPHLDSAKDLARDQQTEADMARAKADVIVARNDIANAREEVSNAAGGIGNGDGLKKLEKDVAAREAEVDTKSELTGVSQENKWAKEERDAAANAEMQKYLDAAKAGNSSNGTAPTASVGGWNVVG